MDAPDYPFPDQYSQPGSDSYYAVRFAPRKLRPALSLVNAMYQSLRDIPLTCSEPEVALAKLEWWKQELDNMERGLGRHPITRALGPVYQRKPAVSTHFKAVLHATASEVGGIELSDQTALEKHCDETGARHSQLLVLVSGGDQAHYSAAVAAGHLLRITEIVRDLGRDLRARRCLLPRDRLNAYDLTRETLFEAVHKNALNTLLGRMVDEQRKRYRQVQANQTGPQTPLGTVQSLTAMAESLLHEIGQDGYRVLTHKTSLTPLRKLWISWRSHRRAKPTDNPVPTG